MKLASSRRLATLTWGAIPIVAVGTLLSLESIPGTDIPLTVPYAAEGPGPTVDTLGSVDEVEVVDVKAPKTFETDGQLNMTTVSVRTRMSLAQALGRWLTTDDTIVPIDTVMPPNVSEEDFRKANQQAFSRSESAATITAMDYLNIPVQVKVAGVMEDSAAADVIKADDLIVAVDGKEVSEPSEVQEIVQGKKPGDTVKLRIERAGKERNETITLKEHPDDAEIALLGITMTSTPGQGIDVTYNLQDIGGPSAGMMFSLAVIDKLSEKELTGGKFVAGTGTIAENGEVGPIGGIEHKVRAAQEAGAELFLAPTKNCEAATSRDYGDMAIAAVDNIDDAVSAMEAFSQGKDFTTCD